MRDDSLVVAQRLKQSLNYSWSTSVLIGPEEDPNVGQEQRRRNILVCSRVPRVFQLSNSHCGK